MITTPTIVPRWTTAVLSRFNALNISPATTSYPAPALHISPHSRSYASRSNSLSSEEHERNRQEARARQNEKQRLRYHSDPEYRDQLRQKAAAKYAANSKHRDTIIRSSKERYAANSEVREKMVQSAKERFANDLVYREKIIKARNKRWQKFMSKLNQDPEAYQLFRHMANEANRVMYREDTEYRWAMALRTRVLRTERLRNEVVWKYHELVLYSTKMDYNCATCHHKRYGGRKLW
jgi:hypothetical protein